MQEKIGLGRVKIVKLEDTRMGALGLSGYDEDSVKYKLLPAQDKNLAAMAWPGRKGTAETQTQEGITWLFVLAGRARISEEIENGLFVGPAVKYTKSGAEVDGRGAALWTKADQSLRARADSNRRSRP